MYFRLPLPEDKAPEEKVKSVPPGGLLGILGGGVPHGSLSWPYFRPKNHTRFHTWGPFLESSGNFSGPKSNIQIEM